jgi:hypothetical protein
MFNYALTVEEELAVDSLRAPRALCENEASW